VPQFLESGEHPSKEREITRISTVLQIKAVRGESLAVASRERGHRLCIVMTFCPQPVSDADARGLGTTTSPPTHTLPTHHPLLNFYSLWLPVVHKMINDTKHYNM
jgi:hypothetical protein